MASKKKLNPASIQANKVIAGLLENSKSINSFRNGNGTSKTN